MMADVNRVISITVDADPALRELGKINKSLDQTGDHLNQLNKTVSSGFGYIRFRDVARITIDAFSQINQAADKLTHDLAKLSREAANTDISPENLQVFQIMAERSGRSVVDLRKVVSTSSAVFQAWSAELRANGEIIESALIEKAERLQDALDSVNNQIERGLTPTLLELERTEVIAKGALAEFAIELIKSVAGTEDLSQAFASLNAYVKAGLEHFAAFAVTLKQVGEMGVTVARIFAEVQALGDFSHFSENVAKFSEDWSKLGKQFGAAFSGDESQKAAERMGEIVDKVTAKVDHASRLPSLPQQVAKGAKEATDYLERIRDALDDINHAYADVNRQVDAARLGPVALEQEKNLQAVDNAALKAADSMRKLGDAAVKANQLTREQSDVLVARASKTAGATEKGRQDLEQINKDWQIYNQTVAQGSTEQEKLNAQLDEATAAFERLRGSMSPAQAERFQTAMENIRNNTKGLKDDLVELGDDIKMSLVDSFSNFATALAQGKATFSDFARSVIADLTQIAIRAALMRVVSAVVGGFAGPGVPAGMTAASGSGGFVDMAGRSARGNVFDGGNVIPFAAGGIVSRPTVFPMASGGTGLMGEAGPEAVVPLVRTSSGKLGVASDGGGMAIHTTVNLNGATQPDDAARIAKAVEVRVRAIVDQRLVQHSRPGGALTSSGGFAAA